jgi:hypothetical protein
MVNVRLSAQNSRPATCMAATPGRQTRHEGEENHMHDQATGLTIITGGIDRSAEYRREARTGKHFMAAFLIVVAASIATTGWLAGVVVTPQAAIAAPAADPYPAIY